MALCCWLGKLSPEWYVQCVYHARTIIYDLCTLIQQARSQDNADSGMSCVCWSIFRSACRDQKLAPFCLASVSSVAHCEEFRVLLRFCMQQGCRTEWLPTLSLRKNKKKKKERRDICTARAATTLFWRNNGVSAILFCSLLSPLFVCMCVCLSLFWCCEMSERGYLSPLWLWDVTI